MIATWQKYANPGEKHKALEPLVGSWTVKMTGWMPGGQLVTGQGTAEKLWVMSGRWVEERLTGEFMGMPLEATGYTGYDNFKQRYLNAWIDNMSTSLMLSSGTLDEETKTLTATTEVDDLMTGKPRAIRTVIRVVDNDRHVLEIHGKGPDGKEVKEMEAVYSRKQTNE